LFFIDHESTQEIEERMVLSGEYYDVFFVTQLTRATALAHIVAVDRVRVEPERHSQTHRHNDAETVLFIESGSGTVVINTIDHFVSLPDRFLTRFKMDI
jgi:mannose-6-phosphate isomerase-like protein (cupin superfamily)